MRRIKKPFLAILLSLVFWLPDGKAAIASEMDLANAINVAGRQRMLTQRVVNAYCQLGLEVEKANSKARLERAIKVFDEQLEALEGFASNPQVIETLARVRELWLPIKLVAEEPVSKDGAALLLYWNDDLLHSTHKVVQLLQDASGKSSELLVNISGRQRMLSQRMAKFYMLREWGFDSPTIRQEMERARNEFIGGLATLRSAPENTVEIDAALEEVSLQWSWFDHAMTLQGGESFRLIVASSAEEILRLMEQVTGLYEAQAQ